MHMYSDSIFLGPLTGAPAVRTTRRVSELAELEVLFEPDINVVVLERALPTQLRADSQALCASLAHRTLLFAVEPNARGRGELAAQLSAAPALACDVRRWVELFADLTDAPLVGVRLVALSSAMCPRLHVDRMSLRTVITYAGEGTEFVDGAHYDRRWLQRAEPPENCPVERAQAGDVVLLKGEAWPDNAGRGAIHRSPPASRAAPRLVLTLDAL